jgi:hypothetical protein
MTHLPVVSITQLLPEEERTAALHVLGLLDYLSLYTRHFQAALELLEFSKSKVEGIWQVVRSEADFDKRTQAMDALVAASPKE